jgi:hypothetical protein
LALSYRVVDLRTKVIEADEVLVEGVASPEAAAEKALGMRLVRSGAKKDLVARVYWQPLGQPVSMVRLYSMAADRELGP